MLTTTQRLESSPCWWGCKQRAVWRFLKTLNVKLLRDLEIPLPGVNPKETKPKGKESGDSARCFARWRLQQPHSQQPDGVATQDPPTNARINGTRPAHVTDGRSAVQRNGVLTHAAARMSPESVMLRDRCQAREDEQPTHTRDVEQADSQRHRSTGYRGLGRGAGGSCSVMGTEVLSGVTESSGGGRRGRWHSTVRVLVPLTLHLKNG